MTTSSYARPALYRENSPLHGANRSTAAGGHTLASCCRPSACSGPARGSGSPGLGRTYRCSCSQPLFLSPGLIGASLARKLSVAFT